jgi:hypothetical protein
MNINDFLKSQPVVILVAAFLLVLTFTPLVFLFSQRQFELELRERQLETYKQLAISSERSADLTVKLQRVELEVDDLRTQMAQTRASLDIALKSLVELQKQRSSDGGPK